MDQRGQLTLFIFLGFLLLGVVLAISYVSWVKPESLLIPSSENDALQMFVQQCLEQTTRQGLIILGAQGGVLDPQFARQFQTIPFYDFNRTYFYVGGDEERNEEVQHIPTKKEMEQQLASWIEQELPSCLADLPSFQNQGLAIRSGKIRVHPTIQDDLVRVKAGVSLIAQEEGKEMRLDTIQIEIPVSLGTMLSLSEKVVQQQVEDDPLLCLTCLHRLSRASGIDLTVQQLPGPEGVLFVLDDTAHPLHEDVLSYQFVFAANRSGKEDVPGKENGN